MVSAFEFSMNMLFAVGKPDEAWAMIRTVKWVRQSCLDDGMPEWLVHMVTKNFEYAYLRNEPMPTLPNEIEREQVAL